MTTGDHNGNTIIQARHVRQVYTYPTTPSSTTPSRPRQVEHPSLMHGSPFAMGFENTPKLGRQKALVPSYSFTTTVLTGLNIHVPIETSKKVTKRKNTW